jgi:hypothetical protein
MVFEKIREKVSGAIKWIEQKTGFDIPYVGYTKQELEEMKKQSEQQVSPYAYTNITSDIKQPEVSVVIPQSTQAIQQTRATNTTYLEKTIEEQITKEMTKTEITAKPLHERIKPVSQEELRREIITQEQLESKLTLG